MDCEGGADDPVRPVERPDVELHRPVGRRDVRAGAERPAGTPQHDHPDAVVRRRSLQRLVPEIQTADLDTGVSGVRAQAISPEGEIYQDFCLVARPNALHVLSAPSPAATASLAIGAEIVSLVEKAA